MLVARTLGEGGAAGLALLGRDRAERTLLEDLLHGRREEVHALSTGPAALGGSASISPVHKM